ncbi:MAG: amidohydrolase [Flavobacteriales bacterium]|nr:amidohydrolase [Flavobacteriales bacterium]
MHTSFIKIGSLFAVATAFTACIQTEEADLVVHNATIYSVDEEFSIHQAMAIKDGKIVELGAEREILNRYKYKEKYDARKKFIYPGFFDAHSHFLGYARNQGEIDLFGTTSFDEVIERVASFVKQSNREWIVGRGWDNTAWANKGFPSKSKLDSLFPDRPVHLTRVDGHAVLVNEEALRRSGIDISTVIEGGLIEKNEEGELTGILLDNAETFAASFIPPMNIELQKELIQKAQNSCFEAGLTSVTDAGISVQDIQLLDSLQKAGNLSIRVFAMLSQGDEAISFMDQGPLKTEKLNVRSIKIYADGALGSRGALLKDPYADDPENYGLKLIPDSLLARYCEIAKTNNFQVITHCIGDSANSFVLNTYAEVLGEISDRRWRIEHAQIVSPEDRSAFHKYAIIPSVQPVHATSDQYWAEERLGPDRIEYAYAYKSLKEELGWIPLGTDFPVEPISPIANFYAAVFRKNPSGKDSEPYQIEQALTREEALRGITIWPALASFEENEKGSLDISKVADFVVLDNDLMKSSEEGILRTQVVATFLSGEQVY